MKKRRTKKRYANLFDDPKSLFGNARVMLFPNGEPEIWIQSPDGCQGFRLTASCGKAGLGLTIRRFVGGAPMTICGNLAPDGEVMPQKDAEEISVTQYRSDDYAQAFKKWYGDSEHNPYPEPPGDGIQVVKCNPDGTALD